MVNTDRKDRLATGVGVRCQRTWRIAALVSRWIQPYR